MQIRLDPESDFYKKLETLYKSGSVIDTIVNALFYVFHPISISFERPFDEKIRHIENRILKGIKYSELEKQGLVRLYNDECIPTELRYYADIKHILDKEMKKAGEAATSSSDKADDVRFKAIKDLVRTFNDFQGDLTSARQTASKVSNKHIRGNEILSMRDQRELEDGN